MQTYANNQILKYSNNCFIVLMTRCSFAWAGYIFELKNCIDIMFLPKRKGLHDVSKLSSNNAKTNALITIPSQAWLGTLLYKCSTMCLSRTRSKKWVHCQSIGPKQRNPAKYHLQGNNKRTCWLKLKTIVFEAKAVFRKVQFIITL